MKKRFRIALVILLAGFIGALAWVVLCQPREPVYQGIRLSVWLESYDNPYVQKARAAKRPGKVPTGKEADEALRHIGTNAIPTLLRLLRARDSNLEDLLSKAAAKLPLLNFEYVSVEQKHLRGVFGLMALGVAATNTLPELLQIYHGNPNLELRLGLAFVFGVMGPPAKPAIPVLLLAAASTNRSNRLDDGLHCNAIWALGEIHAEPETVVPVLAAALHDTNWSVRYAAADALGKFGLDAKPAVPALVPLLSDQELSVRTAAKELLDKIAPETVPKK